MNKLSRFIIGATILFFANTANSETIDKAKWNMLNDGSIELNVNQNLPMQDHIEMSGKEISVVLRYGVDENGEFFLNKSLVWPLLRTIPNNTHASLMRRFDWNPLDVVTVNGRSLKNEKMESIRLKGNLVTESNYDNGRFGKCKLIREYNPSVDAPAFIENYQLINTGDRLMNVELPEQKTKLLTNAEQGVDGVYCIDMNIDTNGTYTLQPNDTLKFNAYIVGYKNQETPITIDCIAEREKRAQLVDSWMNHLVLETPNPVIDRMMAFSKIRAAESIYDTKAGPMHGPGGESYYAAIWANDQAEYINPYFPFLGYDYGNASAYNSYMHFARFMNDEWKPIPSSIIAEGDDIWAGVGDRGDAAMIAYGASRYALALGDKNEADKLWPLITWCLEYCKRNLNQEGVVASDTDELENRFPSGDANLCTSSLYYDALISSAYLAKELGKDKSIAKKYNSEAVQLRKNIEHYFGSTVEGYDTYAYYKGNDVLRSWICIPLTVGIDERADATINALFSPRLWTQNGLLTEAGSETFWDRSTLYALRGVYAVGETDKATQYLDKYSQARLLGNHVPYAIEAWPEGEQRHLSAESGLYGRIITEGLFGIRPTGFKSFTITPRLPSEWNNMALRNIAAFNTLFDIEIERMKGDKLKVTLVSGDKTQHHVIRKDDSLTLRLK